MERFTLSMLLLAGSALTGLSAAPLMPDTINQPSQVVMPDSTITSKENAGQTVTGLNEVTVTADSRSINGNTLTYYPTAGVKKSSTDAIDLLKRMAISSLRIDPVTDRITTPDMEDVVLFINFIPASEADIQGLRGQNVSRVEVLEYPVDSRFRNAPHVVNIILKPRYFGGYTKISDRQEFITTSDNNGFIFSRFNYKRMTYDAYVGSSFSNTSHMGSSSISTYTLKDGPVERHEQPGRNIRKSWNIPVSIQATYNSDYIQIVNTLGYGHGKNIKTASEGRLFFSPSEGAEGYSYARDNSGWSNYITYSGMFFFYLPRDWDISFYPYLSYSHDNYFSGYTTDVPSFSPIVNNIRSKGLSLSSYLAATKTFGKKHSLYLTLHLQNDHSNADYSGTTEYAARTGLFSYSLDVTYQWLISSRMRLVAQMDGSGYRQNSDGKRYSSAIQPSASASFSWNTSDKCRVGLSASLERRYTGYSSGSDVMIRRDEFMYAKGNPDIRPYHVMNLRATCNLMPGKAIDMSAFVRFSKAFNVAGTTYTLNEAGDAVIVSKANMGGYKTFSSGVSLSARLFSNRLTLTASPSFEHSNVYDFFRIVKNQVSYDLSAYMSLGDFSLSASYNPYHWTINPIAGIRDTNKSYYKVGVNWSRSSWIVDLNLFNFFRYDYEAQITRINTPAYSTRIIQDISSYHASARLSVIYSFGYGKKVKRGNELREQGGAAAVIIK